MLIKRLLHRWVLMNEAGGADGGAGGASVAGSADAAGAAGSGADAGNTAGAAAAAGTGSDGAGAAAASGVAAAGEAAKAGVDLAALQPPASLVGEAGKEGEADEGAEGAKEGAEGEGKEAAKVDDAPIEYTDFTLPEGVEASPEQMAAFKEAAAGAKLSQEQAQGLMDLHTKALTEAATKPYEVWRDTQEQWQKEIKADPEFGGAKLETETIPSIAKAIKAFSPTPEAEKALRQAFHLTGAGNHPEMIRFMARIGKSLAEGTHVGGKPTDGDGGKSAAQKLYPTQGGNAQS